MQHIFFSTISMVALAAGVQASGPQFDETQGPIYGNVYFQQDVKVKKGQEVPDLEKWKDAKHKEVATTFNAQEQQIGLALV